MKSHHCNTCCHRPCHRSDAGLEEEEDEQLVDSSPSLYRRVDNDRRRESEGASDDDEVASYFPVALAVSPERPLQFNFDLFLFDAMRLERGLFPDDEAAPVEFASHEDCRAYCTRYVRGVLDEQEHDQHTPSGSSSRHRLLGKQRLFQESGSSLAEQLRTGDTTCDTNLERVRRDR